MTKPFGIAPVVTQNYRLGRAACPRSLNPASPKIERQERGQATLPNL